MLLNFNVLSAKVDVQKQSNSVAFVTTLFSYLVVKLTIQEINFSQSFASWKTEKKDMERELSYSHRRLKIPSKLNYQVYKAQYFV